MTATEKKHKSNTPQTCMVLIGLLFLIISPLQLLYWVQFFDTILYQVLVFTPSSAVLSLWATPTETIRTTFYYYNWTNPSNDWTGDYKVNVSEQGPYVCHEHMRHVDITWNDNGTITFLRNRTWHYDRDMSIGPSNDTVTTLNMIPVTVLYYTRFFTYIMKLGVKLVLSYQDLYQKQTINDLIFDGYMDPVVSAANAVNYLELPYDKVGWLYLRNGSAAFDGAFEMNTGETGMGKYGMLEKWNYRNSTKYFEGECGKVKGTPGGFWPPGTTKNDRLNLFSSDLCRYISFEFTEETSVSGINGYKYTMLPFDEGELDVDNKCYCNGECIHHGLYNTSRCRYGTPAFFSHPHFYTAHESYFENVEGMKPNQEEHESYIILEPITGVPLEVTVRLQINFLVQRDASFSLFQNVKRTFFPLLWMEQTALLSDGNCVLLWLALKVRTSGIIFAAVSLLLSVCLLWGGLRNKICRGEKYPIDQHDKQCS